MVEELIISGRANPEIDPHLHAWPWYVPTDLFLAGLVAGILIFSTVLYLFGKESEYPTLVKRSPLFAPVLLGIALLLLFLDLSHKIYFWQLYTNIRWESPMSWGSWTYLFITPLSVLWAFIHAFNLFPGLSQNYDWTNWVYKTIIPFKRAIAIAILLLSLTLGMYTGILLSAFNARPLWNTSILGPLFLTSGLLTAIAFSILFKSNEKESNMINTWLTGLIALQLFLMIHLVMGYLSGNSVQISAAQLILGGSYTTSFWVFLVGFGLIIPFIIQLLNIKGANIPKVIPGLLVLLGGLLLRLILVEAGQMSRWLYS